MAATDERATTAEPVDFGQALGSLLRSYLSGARGVLDQLPGATRGYQVMAIAAGSTCNNQAEIAHRLGIDRTVLTYLVDDLEAARLVERRPDPADRRARQIVLTAKGRRTLDEAQASIYSVEEEVLGPLTPDEMRVFRGMLAKLVPEMSADVAHACTEALDGV